VSNELMNRAKAMGWAADAPPMKILPRFILMCLADAVRDKRRAADGDVSWPTLKTLCALTSASPAAVKRAIADLKRTVLSDGTPLITIEKWGRHRNRYRLNLPPEWAQIELAQIELAQDEPTRQLKSSQLDSSNRALYTEDHTEPNKQNVAQDAPRLRTLEDVTAEEERRAKAQDPGPLFTKPEQVGYTPPTFTPDVIPEKGPPPPPGPDSAEGLLTHFEEQVGAGSKRGTKIRQAQLDLVQDRLNDGFTPDEIRQAAHGAASDRGKWRRPDLALSSIKSVTYAIDKAAPKPPSAPPTPEIGGWGPRPEGW